MLERVRHRRAGRRARARPATTCSTSEPKPAQWKPTSRYPSSDLDLAFALPDDVPAEKLDKAIRQGAGALLVDLELFDVYRGAGVGDGRRSLAYRLRLQAPDRNLTDADVADVRASGHRGGGQARRRAARLMAARSPRPAPGWVWVVVPMVAVGAARSARIAVAVRSGGDDDGESIAGPAEELPAVVGAADELLGTVPPPATIAAELGTRVRRGHRRRSPRSSDELDFAAEFDRLPDAEARLLGRTLGAIQAQLSPTDVGGARDDDDRAADIVFALQLARARSCAIDPDGTAARPGAGDPAVRRAGPHRLRRDRRDVRRRRPRRAGGADRRRALRRRRRRARQLGGQRRQRAPPEPTDD